MIIVEALLWMDRPLSSSEIVALLEDEEYYISLISYHLRHLADLGVAELVKKTERRGATEKYYALRDKRTR
ncbi:MAG TPA: winged-helix domain-containing protein [Solirubrobacterales bacterium]|nr:winged-helix domain-containing protein [Solirubrobacterales bacterium]